MKKILNAFKNNFYLSLTTLYLFLYLPIIVLRFQDLRNEIKYFVITKEFINNGDMFILRYFSNLYPDKPPLYFWILGFAHKFFDGYFPIVAIILGSTIASFIIVVLIYKMILKFVNKEVAFIGAFSLALLPLFLGLSVFLRMDMLMTMFITYSIYLFCGFYYNWFEIDIKNLALFYFAIFLGLFTKGIAGLAIPLLVIFFFLMLEKNLKFFKKLKIGSGILFIILLVILWFLTIYFSHDGLKYIKLMLGQETLGRIVKSKTHIKPFYYYAEVLPGIIFPYSIAIFWALYINLKDIKSWKNWNQLKKISFIWFIVPLFMFSIASGKLAVYLLPILPCGVILIFITIITSNYKGKNIAIKSCEILLIFPFVFSLLNKKAQNYLTKFKIINLTLGIFIFILLFCLKFYNNYYTIKPFLPLIIREKTIAYSFSDGENLEYFTQYPIVNFTSATDVKNSDSKLIITKRKYSNKLKELGYQLIFENKGYSIFKK